MLPPWADLFKFAREPILVSNGDPERLCPNAYRAQILPADSQDDEHLGHPYERKVNCKSVIEPGMIDHV